MDTRENLKRKVVKNNIGDCYKEAWQTLLDNPTAHLVHGIIELDSGPFEGAQAGHAWIEYEKILPLGAGDCVKLSMVKDVTTNIEIPTSAYMRMANCEYKVKYTLKQAEKKLLETKIFGPWDEIINLALHGDK